MIKCLEVKVLYRKQNSWCWSHFQFISIECNTSPEMLTHPFDYFLKNYNRVATDHDTESSSWNIRKIVNTHDNLKPSYDHTTHYWIYTLWMYINNTTKPETYQTNDSITSRTPTIRARSNPEKNPNSFLAIARARSIQNAC